MTASPAQWEQPSWQTCRCACHRLEPFGTVTEHLYSCRHTNAEPPPDRSWISTECANCGKTRHALGEYCHPNSFWSTAALFALTTLTIIVVMVRAVLIAAAGQ